MSLAESEKVWVAFCDPDLFGPLSAIEIKTYLTEAKLKDDDCLWKKGWNKWKQPKDIPLFAYECKKSIGTGKSIPEIPIPDPEEFKKIITPKISASELDNSTNWDAKRIAIVTSSALLAGIPGAIVAGVLSKKSQKRKEEEQKKASNYIDNKNK